jgi:hypothetical protein
MTVVSRQDDEAPPVSCDPLTCVKDSPKPVVCADSGLLLRLDLVQARQARIGKAGHGNDQPRHGKRTDRKDKESR